ncbi:MAG: chemotaxis protein [Firmicutes bacterium]|nr:chemotaxis protein [Bacillota bacterium]
MQTLYGKEALNALIAVLPIVIQALPDDMALFVTDGKKYLQVAEGPELSTGIELGSEILGRATAVCMEEKRKTVYHVRQGVPFKGVNIPVMDENGEPVGTLICAIGRKTQQEVNQGAQQLSEALDQMAQAISEIAEGAARLAEVGHTLMVQSAESSKRIKETEKIINTITEISAQTNLLGLNASIEAARAGENGRGFGVVAQEIRNLADNSKEAAEEVKAIIAAISKSVGEMIKSAEESGTIAEEQAAATEENSATIEQLRQIAHNLKNTAAKL